MRRNIINKQFFEKIDTQEKAYILGFIYSDGNVLYDSARYIYRISIEIQENDDYILKRISNLIFGKEYLYHRHRNDRWKKLSCICISNKNMALDLIKLGCMPNKSFKIRFPNKEILPEYLIPHFIRGYFDGDGGFSVKSTDKKGRIHITSNPDFCYDIQDVLKKYSIVSYVRVRHRRENGINRKPIGELTINSRHGIKYFFDFLYNDNPLIFLTRKKEKIENYISTFDQKYFQCFKIFLPDGSVEETNDIELFAKKMKLWPKPFIEVADGKRASFRKMRVMYCDDKEFRHKNCKGNMYKVIHPDGSITVAKNLSKFCRDNNLNYEKMITNLVGRSSNHKGYQCMKLSDSQPKYIDKRPFRSLKISLALQKKYLIKYKDGSVVEIINLNKFCKDNGYNISCIYQVKNGQRKFHKDIIGFEKLN